MNRNQSFGLLATHLLLILFGVAMVYPLIWMFFASFKTTNEIFVSPRLLPEIFLWENYVNGWRSAATGAASYTNFFINTFVLVIPTVAFTVLSSLLVAYGFGRFRFPGRKILFSLMIATLMLPNAVIVIPRFMIFKNLGWLDSYLPFIVPAIFGCYPFFIFMLIQFLRGIPTALDESAKIDGCGPVRILFGILAPLMKPALFSAGLFQFLWTWNDFFNQLIFINSPKKYTIALGLRISIDSSTEMVRWNEVMAMSICSILPLILLFFFAQRYFVEGISTSGLKG
jgi:oligogalacturonide transport system permease protein